MNDFDTDRDRAVAALRELVEALDRRVPHVERLGEVRIAREAAALRKEAAERIEQLEPRDQERRISEGERSDAAITDDGGPVFKK